MDRPRQSPWLHSRAFDLTFFILPSFAVTAAVFLFPAFFAEGRTLPGWAWVLFVMGVDVSHVYGTLYKTYLDPREFAQRRRLLLAVPAACWAAGAALYAADPLWFWRALAYAAVYHFVRQQYGFMMLYARKECSSDRYSLALDKAAIYLATLYPLAYWHNLPREFEWFVPEDFVRVSGTLLSDVVWLLYASALVAYAAKEIARYRTASPGKSLVLAGTTISWYVGIVLKNGDVAFTITNVVSHGVPYLALVWLSGSRRRSPDGAQAGRRAASLFRPAFVPLFLLPLLTLAYLEEGLWDGLVWRERAELFAPFRTLIPIGSHALLSLVVPLLALPQATHYVLDGFIWRVRRPDPTLSAILDRRPAT